MAENSLIPDDLLRQLIGVGNVDLVVGVPTLNHGETIATIVAAVHASFRTHFPRQRTVLLHSDAGSTDDTVAIVRDCCSDSRDSSGMSRGLRTTHRISAYRQGIAGRGDAVRQMFAAADLLHAQTVVILDPDVANVTPEWVTALALPVRDNQVDFVAPVYDRAPSEGLLITQLLRPLIQGVYGRRLQEPLAREFGCSSRFVQACLGQELWLADSALNGADVWITSAALTGPFTTWQTRLGRREPSSRPQPPLSALFQQMVGATLQTIDAHANWWLGRNDTRDIPCVGTPSAVLAPDGHPSSDGAALLESFAEDLRNLDEVLRIILLPETFSALAAAAHETTGRMGRFPGALWAATVADFLVAYHRGVMRRDHVTQALLPLYTARSGAFLLELADAGPAAFETSLGSLCGDFEHVKAHIVGRWPERE